MWISGILAGVFNMFVNPIALGSIGWKYYFTFIAFLIFYLVIVYFFFPETRGRTLEQMAFVFDDEEEELLPVEIHVGRGHASGL
jgi:cbb3-type cytochrome oxidase subunit 3